MSGTRALVLVAALASSSVACGGQPANAPRPRVAAVSPTAKPPSVSPCESADGEWLEAERAEGTRILDVCIVGVTPEVAAGVRKYMRIRPDSTLTAAAVRDELRAIHESHFFSRVEAAARSHEGSTVLFLFLEERPRITAFHLDGAHALAQELRDSTLVKLPKVGDPLDVATLVAVTHKLEEEYASRGWDEATVTHSVTAEGEGGARVKIAVVEGRRARVGKVTFEGVQGGREPALRKALQLEEGAPLGEDNLTRSALLANAFYYDRGFLTVKIDEPKRTRAADGTTAIKFAITEGPVFKIGTLRIKKVDTTTEKTLLAAMQSKPGDVFNRSKVIADLETIRSRAGKNGNPVTAEPQTELDAKKGIVDIVIVLSDEK